MALEELQEYHSRILSFLERGKLMPEETTALRRRLEKSWRRLHVHERYAYGVVSKLHDEELSKIFVEHILAGRSFNEVKTKPKGLKAVFSFMALNGIGHPQISHEAASELMGVSVSSVKTSESQTSSAILAKVSSVLEDRYG